MVKEKLSKPKLILYVVSLVLSVLACAILILLRFHLNRTGEQEEPTKYLVDFFVGLCSSVFVTILFAFLLDLISLRESNEKKKIKRNLYLNPIKSEIMVLFHSACFFLDKDKSYNFNDFAEILNKDFDGYCEVIEKISHGGYRDCKLLNEAYNYKNGIEVYRINPLVQAIDEISNAHNVLISEGLFSQWEITQLHYFKKDVERLRLPYLGTLSKDRNVARDFIDWPKEPINDLVKQNYKGATKAFYRALEGLCNTIPEFKAIFSLEAENKGWRKQ